MLAIDADAIDLDPSALVEGLRRDHRRGVGEVGRLLLSEPPNDLLLWGAWRHGEVLGAKLVTVFPGNETGRRGPNIRSTVLLADGADGRPLAVLTGESFTRVKTAADSALGASLLARPDAETLAVLGAGSQAATHTSWPFGRRSGASRSGTGRPRRRGASRPPSLCRQRSKRTPKGPCAAPTSSPASRRRRHRSCSAAG